MRGRITASSRRRLLRAALAVVCILPAACATRRSADGREETSFDPKYLVKSDIDRVLDVSRELVMAGLMRIADKLYRRNPREWKKANLPGSDAALLRLARYRNEAPADLAGRQEGAAALQAFNPDYAHDRVAALMYGLLTMIDAAYEHKDEFFLLDSLDAQKFYNCARNLEIAVWKLSASRDAAGEPLLYSNEMGETSRNLSFERTFGGVIDHLDFISRILADKNGRTVTKVTHSLATSLFLPVGMLK
ncbi:lipoprotein [Betaproteobacteria bacterium]|nr:lipoprotein [Betaproteobacteria bacterium]GHU41473.1 lipoprotein [Betaproteobacteria bacterium]